MHSTQAMIASYFRDKADWRARKAEEYPDDARNLASAAILRLYAELVEALPDDDPSIRAIRECGESCLHDGIFDPGEQGERLIRYFGFDTHYVDAFRWNLELLAGRVEGDYAESLREAESRS